MHILLILAAGLVVVIAGIVLLRLPAFLALTLAAILVGVLTPRENRFEAFLSQNAGRITDVSSTSARFSGGRFTSKQQLTIAPKLPGLSDDQSAVAGKARAALNNQDVIPAYGDSFEAVAVGDLVVAHRHIELSTIHTNQTTLKRVTDSMGVYFGKLAIIIVCASLIGRCLLDSGAAERIVRTALGLVGQRLAPAALTVSSFVLGIPVFFDTVFYLMIPIAKTLRVQIGANYLLYVLAIVAGATMAHSLVPPTPGPLAVAEMLNVEVSKMIVGGVIVGAFAAVGGLLWASLMNHFFNLDLPEEDAVTLESTAQKSAAELPPLWLAALPIALPLVLISVPPLLNLNHPFLVALSNKNTALLISAAAALALYVWSARPTKKEMSDSMQSAVGSAGAILLITCAGGAFGQLLFQTNVASMLNQIPGTSPIIFVVAAFLITASIRTAQGSATVAMMTSAGIFGPLAHAGVANVAPLYVALAIGCGSKPISWMNDSGFWIVTRMSGMKETEGLKFISPLLTIMGIVGLLVVIAGVVFVPNP
jgi:GntP family gluconate:H+ symporter